MHQNFYFAQSSSLQKKLSVFFVGCFLLSACGTKNVSSDVASDQQSDSDKNSDTSNESTSSTDGNTSLDSDSVSDSETASDSYSDSDHNDTSGDVLPSDTVLVAPSSSGPIIASIASYNKDQISDWPDDYFELPIYKVIDRNDDRFWNWLLDELLLARVDTVMFHGRGCYEIETDSTRGPGNMCPKLLSKFADAVTRAGAKNAIRVGMFMDTASWPGLRNTIKDLDSGTLFDLSDSSSYDIIWEYNVEIFFDTVPQELWFRLDGKPVMAFWNLSDSFFTNQQGNASKFLARLKNRFENKYGVEPLLIIQNSWKNEDSTIETSHADGMHSWFSPKSDIIDSIYSYTSYNSDIWGVVAPSYKKEKGTFTKPGCGESCREVTRRDGQTLANALQAGKDAKFILLEAWTNISESGAFFRGKEWSYPTQYINIVRHSADPSPATLRFQAEGADSFFDKTSGNSGDSYRDGDLDIGLLDDNTGWFVGWTQADEWIEYQNVELGCGTYRFTASVATDVEGKSIRLDLEGLQSVNVPNTGGGQNFELVHLGEAKLKEGKYNLRILFETGDTNLDWFFVKRANDSCQ